MATPSAPPSPTKGHVPRARRRTNTASSVAHSVQSIANEVLQADPPLGFFAATAEAVSHAPTVGEIRRGSFGADGWNAEQQVERRRRALSQGSKKRVHRLSTGSTFKQKDERGVLEAFPPVAEELSRAGAGDGVQDETPGPPFQEKQASEPGQPEKEADAEIQVEEPDASLDSKERADHDHERIQPLKKGQRVYTSGYVPPPVIPWTTSARIALKAFSKWCCTPFGFLVTIYGLNVVAWGGMLFLLLCNASPQMCWAPIHDAADAGHHSPAHSLAFGSKYPRYYNCNDINSPRRIWLEIDSQILNALFCVTGFGLIPWRFRDLYYLLRWRLTSQRRYGREKKMYGLRVLAGIHRSWFRLPGSQTLDEQTAAEYEQSFAATRTGGSEPNLEGVVSQVAEEDQRLPLPLSKSPNPPLTGVRAPPTALWKLDFFIWCQVLNTFLQGCLCGFMWGLDRYTRPSWSTGLFIALACIVVAVAGVVSFIEGGRVKRVEGVQAKTVEETEKELGLKQTRTAHESVHVGNAKNGNGVHPEKEDMMV